MDTIKQDVNTILLMIEDIRIDSQYPDISEGNKSALAEIERHALSIAKQVNLIPKDKGNPWDFRNFRNITIR